MRVLFEGARSDYELVGHQHHLQLRNNSTKIHLNQMFPAVSLITSDEFNYRIVFFNIQSSGSF